MVDSIRKFQELALERVRQTYKPHYGSTYAREINSWNGAVASIEKWLTGQMEDAKDYPLMGDASHLYMPIDEREMDTNVE